MRKILRCISTIEELDVEQLNHLGIGLEMQDFTEPNLTPAEKQDLIERYQQAFKDLNGIKAMHGPFLDLRPASPDNKIREVSYNKYLETLQTATALDIDYLIFHSQIVPQLNLPVLNDLNNEQANDFWVEILEETDFKGTILIENIFEGPEMLKQYMDVVQFPNVKINLDIGHAKVAQTHLEDWLEIFGDKIAYMHVHSNDGIYDVHQAPTKAEIEQLYQLLDKHQLDPVLSLEYQTTDFEEEFKKYL